MTEKKMRRWIKTFVMLLPIVFVVLFGVHLHRHDLPQEITTQTGSSLVSPTPGTVYEPQTITTANLRGPYDDSGYYVIVIDGNEYYFDYSQEQFRFSENLPSTIINNGDSVEITVPFTVIIDELTEGQNEILFTQNTYKTYTQPLQIIAVSFNEYINEYTSIDVFNIDEFYDWSERTFFDGTAPLYYKPVFSILVYEFVIELLFLLFSFITFVIRFAQKWIDGLYERRY